MKLPAVPGPCSSARSSPAPWCAWCYENLRCRASHKGHRWYRARRPVPFSFWEVIMKRPDNVPVFKKGSWSCPDPAWSKAYPSLCMGMCDLFWDDGKPRECWSLTLRFDGLAVHACVNDKGAGQGLYGTGESVNDVLAHLEHALSQGVAQWRRWRK